MLQSSLSKYQTLLMIQDSCLIICLKYKILWHCQKCAIVTFLEWNDRIFSPFNEDEVFDFINGLTMTEDDPEKSMNEIADWFEGVCLY